MPVQTRSSVKRRNSSQENPSSSKQNQVEPLSIGVETTANRINDITTRLKSHSEHHIAWDVTPQYISTHCTFGLSMNNEMVTLNPLFYLLRGQLTTGYPTLALIDEELKALCFAPAGHETYVRTVGWTVAENKHNSLSELQISDLNKLLHSRLGVNHHSIDIKNNDVYACRRLARRLQQPQTIKAILAVFVCGSAVVLASSALVL